MQGKRTDRIAELIRQCIGQNILSKLRDPRLGFVTITHVSVAPDLKMAKVYYTVLGDEKVRKSTEAALERSRGFLQREIAHEIKMRTTPILSFEYDLSTEDRFKIDEILKKIHNQDQANAASQ
ncbi:MAG: 30S ribosome-binding factor RbfA [Candidatus Omnitrophica bacterium]|nr:30S ribosome-binding factor RbfA [Candidatus Omnitrophota bacterium]